MTRTRRQARAGSAPSRRGSSVSASALARAFVEESRRRLRDEYLAKIVRVVALLDDSDLWWRPNPRSNSIGNLLLHLDGNLRQWMVHGVGGEPDVRERDAEFAARGGPSGRALVRRLRRTVGEADAVLAGLEPRELQARRRIQGYDVTVLQAVYHVVEHFSGHTGQLLYVAKLRRRRDLDLYPHLKRSGPSVRKRPRRFM